MVKEAYPGTISSVILSVFVVMILLVPFYMANQRDKVRTGEGEYEFKEVICFDINSEDQFFNEYNNWYNNYPPGAFSFMYRIAPGRNYHSMQPVDVVDIIEDGTVDEEAYGFTKVFPGHTIHYAPLPHPSHSAFISFVMNFGKNEIIDLDVTRMDIYLDINNAPFDEIYFEIGSVALDYYGANEDSDPWTKIHFSKVTLGEVTSISISVDDLLEINTLPEERKIAIKFHLYDLYSPTNLFPANEVVTFDMQWYHIEEVKITTIDYMGIAMLGGGIFMTFCSILMLPNVTFSGLIGRTAGKNVG